MEVWATPATVLPSSGFPSIQDTTSPQEVQPATIDPPRARGFIKNSYQVICRSSATRMQSLLSGTAGMTKGGNERPRGPASDTSTERFPEGHGSDRIISREPKKIKNKDITSGPRATRPYSTGTRNESNDTDQKAGDDVGNHNRTHDNRRLRTELVQLYRSISFQPSA
nr:hypothetical protein CFP56_67573 [Quercus suber]